MKSRFNKVRKASDTSEKIAPNKGIGKLSDNPKLKEFLLMTFPVVSGLMLRPKY